MRIPHRNPARRRSAFTLVEVMVALVLIAVGFLGIAGSSALALRAAAAQAREQRAIHRIALRLARLAAAGCAAARDGAATDAATGTRETWQVTAPDSGAVMVRDSIEWPTAGGTRSLAIRSALLC